MLCAALLSLLLAATPETARVLRVSDGDTITVRLDGHTEKVRLVGIDSPELHDDRQDYRDVAYAAKNYARSLLGGETVTLDADPRQGNRDRYGRLLRYVILDDGTNVNEKMVREGYAHVYTRFNFALKARFKLAEDEAKRGRLGVWALAPGPWREVPDSAR
jgi:micrococcal nuclease